MHNCKYNTTKILHGQHTEFVSLLPTYELRVIDIANSMPDFHLRENHVCVFDGSLSLKLMHK